MITLNSASLAVATAALIATAALARADTVSTETNQNNDVQTISASADTAHRQTDENACAPVTIVVALKKVAFDSSIFKGVGFYSNFQVEGSQSPFIDKGALSPETTVTLKDGEAAYRVQFSGLGLCWQGDETSSEMQQDQFKPYAYYEYTDASGVLHKITNWDQGANGLLGFGSWTDQILSFDRSSDLLK